MPNETTKTEGFAKLLEVMKALRAPSGCPWDRAQDHESLRTYFLQEAYEVIDAIEDRDTENLCEELGDVLYQIVFHAQIAEENGDFTIDDVANGIAQKMIDRHPFIFTKSDEIGKNVDENNWEERKFHSKKRTHLLNGLPKSLPSLLMACIMQSRVDSMCHVKSESKPSEAFHFFQEAYEQAMKCETADEKEYFFGYLLFETVRLIRTCDADPELCLRRYNRLYAKRFGELEDLVHAAGEPVTNITEAMLQDMEKELISHAHGKTMESPAD